MSRAVRMLLVSLVGATALLVTGTVMAITVDRGPATNTRAAHAATTALPTAADPSHWTNGRMSSARARDPLLADDTLPANPSAGPLPDNVAAARPPRVNAVAAPRPYNTDAVAGKLFFDMPDGPATCSGTVVADPSAPGRSNLVWTAAHCLHGGQGGTWFGNVQFVPAYNSAGNGGATAPYGSWHAVSLTVPDGWVRGGTHTASPASAFDYAVVRVAPQNGRSLEETVGRALPVWFDAPRDVTWVSVYGYPQDPPYDGMAMYHCDEAPRRWSVAANEPDLLRIGCPMSGGASGGGWYATEPDGRTALVSSTTVGSTDRGWIAGPYLGDDARALLAEASASGG